TSIPASIFMSKIRVPELEEPVTCGGVIVDRGEDPKDACERIAHFSQGCHFWSCHRWLLADPLQRTHPRRDHHLLTWIGRGFGIHHHSLQLVLRYDLKVLMSLSDALLMHCLTIASYALCGFANLGSLGIQIGVLSALARAPRRTHRPQRHDMRFHLDATSRCIACVSHCSFPFSYHWSVSADGVVSRLSRSGMLV
ncbi:hypothetical protein EDB89DRAFT_1975537, partial [Lactarius sanguifluus]